MHSRYYHLLMFLVLTFVSRLKFMDLLAGFITGHFHWCGIIPLGTLSQEAGQWLERSWIMLPFSWHNSEWHMLTK